MTRLRPRFPRQTTFFVFGADSTLGRDEFLRILYGARVSFEVAILATLGAISIGVLLGSIAGYYRGWADTVVSRVTEITMAFPSLLFMIALASTIGDSRNNITFHLTLFGWFYPARIIRAHILPHLVAPIIVYSTLAVASAIITEAGLSYLGVGIKLPTASWGNLLQRPSRG